MGLLKENSTTSSYCIKMVALVMAALILVLSQKAAAADGEESCISSIVPCANYLNATTKPPTECCEPLLNVINTQQECLCNVLNSTVMQQFNINITQALHLPVLCGAKNVSTNACSSSGTVKTPPSSATPAGSESTDKSGAEAASVEILLPLLAFLFLGVSV